MNTQLSRRLATAIAFVAFALFANAACTDSGTPPLPTPTTTTPLTPTTTTPHQTPTTTTPHPTPPKPSPTTTAPPPQPPLPDNAATQICDTAAAAYDTLGRSRDLSSVANSIGTIRQLNLQRADTADGLFLQVWQVVDAWNGTMALLNDPSTTDMATPDTVEAALGDLVQFCQQ
jgi:type IV secretory pathway VirB10-like protein